MPDEHRDYGMDNIIKLFFIYAQTAVDVKMRINKCMELISYYLT